MAKSQLRVKQLFPSITSYKHQNELEKLVLVNRPSFQNHNFNQFQSFQVCPSFSPFVLAMILLRYDTRHFSSFHVLSSYLHSTHVQYTQYTNGYDSSNPLSIGTNGTIGTNGK